MAYRSLITFAVVGIVSGCKTPPAASPVELARPRVGAGQPGDENWLPIGNSPVRGAPGAGVTIVVFSDFQCPHCSRVGPILERLERTFPDELRVVFKHRPLPFHRDARLAAEASIEAQEQGRFWAFHDRLFADWRRLGRADLERHARALHLDLQAFRKALDGRRHLHRVRQDNALAVRLGVSGVPTIFVNGRRIVGTRPFAHFARVVREEIKAAGNLLARGVARERLYVELLRGREARARALAGRRRSSRRRRPNAPAFFKVYVGPRDPCRGPVKAPVTVVGFADFQCPLSARAARTVRALLAAYPAGVRYCFKHRPLRARPQSRPAALAALEAHAQGRFWAYHDLLFRNQRALSNADLERHAVAAGLEVGRFRDALEHGRHRLSLERDLRLARRAGVESTPTFFINGRRLEGAQPLSAFRRVVADELRKGPSAISLESKTR